MNYVALNRRKHECMIYAQCFHPCQHLSYNFISLCHDRPFYTKETFQFVTCQINSNVFAFQHLVRALGTTCRFKGKRNIQVKIFHHTILYGSSIKVSCIWGIHKIHHTLRGGRRGSTKCDIVWQGRGGILNFVTSHLKNSTKAIYAYQDV